MTATSEASGNKIQTTEQDDKETELPTSMLTLSSPKIYSAEDLKCRYSPLNWKLQGYSKEEYEYFDGMPGSADQRFLIDSETDSMEG